MYTTSNAQLLRQQQQEIAHINAIMHGDPQPAKNEEEEEHEDEEEEEEEDQEMMAVEAIAAGSNKPAGSKKPASSFASNPVPAETGGAPADTVAGMPREVWQFLSEDMKHRLAMEYAEQVSSRNKAGASFTSTSNAKPVATKGGRAKIKASPDCGPNFSYDPRLPTDCQEQERDDEPEEDEQFAHRHAGRKSMLSRELMGKIAPQGRADFFFQQCLHYLQTPRALAGTGEVAKLRARSRDDYRFMTCVFYGIKDKLKADPTSASNKPAADFKQLITNLEDYQLQVNARFYKTSVLLVIGAKRVKMNEAVHWLKRNPEFLNAYARYRQHR